MQNLALCIMTVEQFQRKKQETFVFKNEYENKNIK